MNWFANFTTIQQHINLIKKQKYRVKIFETRLHLNYKIHQHENLKTLKIQRKQPALHVEKIVKT